MGKLNYQNGKIKSVKSTKLLKLLQIIHEVAKYWNPCLFDSKTLSVHHVLTIHISSYLFACFLSINLPLTSYHLSLIFKTLTPINHITWSLNQDEFIN